MQGFGTLQGVRLYQFEVRLAVPPRGISLLLIERGDGVSTSQMKTTYSTCAGTALVVLEDVRVPVSNLLGKENEGFKLIMYNFNHERWFICQAGAQNLWGASIGL